MRREFARRFRRGKLWRTGDLNLTPRFDEIVHAAHRRKNEYDDAAEWVTRMEALKHRLSRLRR
jgi:hypothetical protein